MNNVLVLEDSQDRAQKFHDALDSVSNLYIVDCARDAISLLEILHFDWAFLDHDLGGQVMVNEIENTGYEVALWLKQHQDRMPDNVVIHSMNPAGSKRMHDALPQAQMLPAAWDYLR